MQKFIEEVKAADWDSFAAPYFGFQEPPAALIALACTERESKAGFIKIKGVKPDYDLLLNPSITTDVMFAIGNSHRGTYYPVVSAALPFIIQVALHGNHIVARNCAINILIDLYGFEPEYAPMELQESVRQTIENVIEANRENFEEFAAKYPRNKTLVESLWQILEKKDFEPEPEMPAAEVVSLIKLFEMNKIEVHIDGGWGVDALLGEQTRKHGDLDIAVPHRFVPRVRELLEACCYGDVPRPDTSEYNFVMGDNQGHLVDIHSYMFDETGRNVFGIAYQSKHLTGSGVINGHRVKCIPPEVMVEFHTGYEADEKDYHDVKVLCERFNIPLPEKFKTSS